MAVPYMLLSWVKVALMGAEPRPDRAPTKAADASIPPRKRQTDLENAPRKRQTHLDVHNCLTKSFPFAPIFTQFFALSWCKCVNLVKNRRGEIFVLLADKTRAFWADNVCVHACPSYIYTWPKFLVYHRYEGIYSKRRRACALGFLWLRWREGTFLSLRQQQIMCFLPRALRRKWPFSLFYAA